jgi:hypothetical protein
MWLRFAGRDWVQLELPFPPSGVSAIPWYPIPLRFLPIDGFDHRSCPKGSCSVCDALNDRSRSEGQMFTLIRHKEPVYERSLQTDFTFRGVIV